MMQQRFCWILDNGHGKLTRGKRSPKMSDGRQLMEYEFNRAIVKLIAEELDRLCIANIILVPEVMIGNFVKGRTERANEYAKKISRLPTKLLSIHANAVGYNNLGDGWSDVHGIETLHYPSKGSAQMAEVFQRHLITATNWKDRGLKPRKNLFLLRESIMSAVMTESGFMTHPEQSRELLDPHTRKIIAMAHVEAIKEIEWG